MTKMKYYEETNNLLHEFSEENQQYFEELWDSFNPVSYTHLCCKVKVKISSLKAVIFSKLMESLSDLRPVPHDFFRKDVYKRQVQGIQSQGR